jgi:hypothetical protein
VEPPAPVVPPLALGPLDEPQAAPPTTKPVTMNVASDAEKRMKAPCGARLSGTTAPTVYTGYRSQRER